MAMISFLLFIIFPVNIKTLWPAVFECQFYNHQHQRRQSAYSKLGLDISNSICRMWCTDSVNMRAVLAISSTFIRRSRKQDYELFQSLIIMITRFGGAGSSSSSRLKQRSPDILRILPSVKPSPRIHTYIYRSYVRFSFY